MTVFNRRRLSFRLLPLFILAVPASAQNAPARPSMDDDHSELAAELDYVLDEFLDLLSPEDQNRAAGVRINPLATAEPLLTGVSLQSREILISSQLAYILQHGAIATMIANEYQMHGFADMWIEYSLAGGELNAFEMAGLGEEDGEAFFERNSTDINGLFTGMLGYVVGHEVGHIVLGLASQSGSNDSSIEERVDEWAVNVLLRSAFFPPSAGFALEVLTKIDDKQTALRVAGTHGTSLSRARRTTAQLASGIERWGSRLGVPSQRVPPMRDAFVDATNEYDAKIAALGGRSPLQYWVREADRGDKWSALLVAWWYAFGSIDEPGRVERVRRYTEMALPRAQAMYLMGWLAEFEDDDLLEAYGWYSAADANGSWVGGQAADLLEDRALAPNGFRERTIRVPRFGVPAEWGDLMEDVDSSLDWEESAGWVDYDLRVRYLAGSSGPCAVSISIVVENRDTGLIMWDHDGETHLVDAVPGDTFRFSGRLRWDRPWAAAMPSTDWTYDCW